MLVDSHCHLDFFKDLKPVVKRALEIDVKMMISCATNLDSIKSHIKIQKQFKEIQVCLGVHPADLLRMKKEEITKAIKLVEENSINCVGIGEIGLDYKYAKSNEEKKLQEDVFRIQIRIALQNDLPIVVHSRFAEEKAMEVLKEEGAKRVLMHWFTNSVKSVKIAKENGFFMSAGPITLSSGEALKVAKFMPEELLLLETDAPVAYLGKQSEPNWIKKVLEKISLEKDIKKEILTKTTTKNAFRLFGLGP